MPIAYEEKLIGPILIKLKVGLLRDFKEHLLNRIKTFYPRIRYETDIEKYNAYEILEVLSHVECMYENGCDLDVLVRYLKIEFDDSMIGLNFNNN